MTKLTSKLLITLLLFMVLMFEWVLGFRMWVLTVIIGTCIYGILVIDGYLYSRVYSISSKVYGISQFYFIL